MRRGAAALAVVVGALLMAAPSEAAKHRKWVKPKPAAAASEAPAEAPPAEPSPSAAAATVSPTHEKQIAPKDAAKGPEAKTVKAGSDKIETHEFQAVEVEGRLRSPQIIYFLRRIRAEFAARDLGHRSFLRELSDTRRDPTLR